MKILSKIGGAVGTAAMGTAGGPFGWVAVAWQKKGLILGLLGWVLIGPAWLHGCSTSVQQEKDRVAARNLEAEKTNSAALEAAAAERLKAELEIAASEREAINAIEQARDEGVSDAGIALGCSRMQRRGFDLAAIPECERYAPGREAPGGD